LRNYEIMLIIRPTDDEEAFKASIEKISGWIVSGQGEVVKTDLWGRRRMAYTISGIRDGLYAVLTFKMDPASLPPLEHSLKLAEDVVRYLVLSLED
jgi:small subunit ribosomal protein S6